MKQMKLIALLAAAMMVQGTHAGPKMDKAKQMGTVGIHLAKVATGCMLWEAAWNNRIKDEDRKWGFGGSFLLIADGLYDLHHDLHRHIFMHLNAWWRSKQPKK